MSTSGSLLNTNIMAFSRECSGYNENATNNCVDEDWQTLFTSQGLGKEEWKGGNIIVPQEVTQNEFDVSLSCSFCPRRGVLGC
jgi:hypothetical protein